MDTRGAVPASRPAAASPFADTDPDGIPVMIPPQAEADEDAEAEPLPISIDLDAEPDEPVTDPAEESAEVPALEPAPVLLPDAILPAGVTPPSDSAVPIPQAQPAPAPEVEAEQSGVPKAPWVVTPVSHAEGGIPIDTSPSSDTRTYPAPPAAPAPGPVGPGGPSGPDRPDRPDRPDPGLFGTGPLSESPAPATPVRGRKPLLIGGGAAAALIIGASIFAVAGSSGGDEAPKAGGPPAASATPAVPKPAPPPPVDISSEKTDKKPLELTEVFPRKEIDLAGRPYAQDRHSVNHNCALAANGAMAKTLVSEKCRKVLRVTFLDKQKGLAVTTGVAVMPNRAVALRVSRAGDARRYEWFKAMEGKNSQQIDQAGGYALSTVRGRYIVYAYAQYANGKRAKPGDTTLKGAAQQFVDYTVRPIEARAGR